MKRVVSSNTLAKKKAIMINPTENEIPHDAAPTTEMHIDEESRPRFPPSTQTVLPLTSPNLI